MGAGQPDGMAFRRDLGHPAGLAFRVSWYAWVLLWLVLLAGAALVLFQLGRARWRQVRALARELSDTVDRLESVADRLADVGKTPEGRR
ncbi:MAG: hypothetical protein ACRDGH_09745 [Candidatus Limnocylindria bacterium]